VTTDGRAPSSARQANRDRLLAALRAAGSLPQVELARAIGVSPATVSTLVQEMVADGWVSVTESVHNGRRAKSVRIEGGSGLLIGIDLAHRHLRVVLAGADYEALAEEATLLTGSRSLVEDVERARAVIDRLLAETGRGRDDVLATGVAVPAPVDPVTGTPMPTGILLGWSDGDRAAERIAEGLGTEIHLGNDANLGLIAESIWGAARGEHDVAYIHIATGIGTGLMAGGRVLHGARGMAGELGHNTIDENGPLCRCGNRGCVDVYASTPAVLRLLSDRHGTELELPDLLRLVEQRDHAALRVIEDAGRYVGPPVAQLCNLLNPSVVLIGGDLTAAGDTLLEPVRNAVRRHTMPGAGDTVRITTGMLGERAAALGALVHAARSSHAGAVSSAQPERRQAAAGRALR
jgi:predicted NBD/HSP70 family sugar kinase